MITFTFSQFLPFLSLTTKLVLLLAVFVQYSMPDNFHPSLRDTSDPIDPTGQGNPGIVIVYKKSDPPPQNPSCKYCQPGPNYDQQHNYHHQRLPPPPPQQYGPYNFKQQPGFRPTCASSGDSYCLFDRDYPMDKVKTIVQHYTPRVTSLYEELNHYSTQEYIVHDNTTHNYRHKGNFICESDVSYVRPGWAKNWKGEWVAVVNTDVYPQSVRIETCKYPKKKCEYMPPCYKSYCVQRYTYVKLICVDPYNPDKRPTVDVFEIPSACSCFVEHFPLYK